MKKRSLPSSKSADFPRTPKPRRDPASVPERSRDALQGEQPMAWAYLDTMGVFAEADQLRKRLVKDDPGVLKAARTLVAEGVSEKYLWITLYWIEGSDSSRLQREFGFVPGHSHWNLPAKMSLKVLRGLSRRMENLAELIETVNSHEWYAPGQSPEAIRRREVDGLVQYATERLLDLPHMLRLYREHLQERIKLVSKVRRGVGRGKRRDFALKKHVLTLVTAIRDVTGTAHWEELSTLVTAVLDTPPHGPAMATA
jgi:hypothetical protein